MKASEHPNTESIVAFIEAPDNSEHGALKQHLAQCPACRQTAGKLSMLFNNLQEFVPESINAEAATLSEQDALDVAQYVSGELDQQRAQQIADKLQQDDSLMKAALHYSLHGQAMEKEVSIDTSATTTGASQANNGFALGEKLINIWQEFRNWRPAVWISAPVTAMLVIVLMTNFSIQKTNMVAVYQDDPVVHFQKTTQAIPGIGFFNAARDSSRKYGKVLASSDKQGLITMQWPAVENASNYTVSIYRLEGLEKVVLDTQLVAGTSTTFTEFTPEKRHHYFWEIKGKTTDGQLFYTDGGFVVTQE